MLFYSRFRSLFAIGFSPSSAAHEHKKYIKLFKLHFADDCVVLPLSRALFLAHAQHNGFVQQKAGDLS